MVGNDPRVYVWNVRRRALSSVLQGHTAMIAGVWFAHTGYMLATKSEDGTTSTLGRGIGGAPGDRYGGFLGFSPDDRRLAFRNGRTIGVWDWPGRGVPDAPPRHARQPLRAWTRPGSRRPLM